MINGLLLIAAGFRGAQTFVERLSFTIPGHVYKRVTVTSQLVLTPEELAAWQTEMDIDERVVIYRRGLLREQQAREGGEASDGATGTTAGGR